MSEIGPVVAVIQARMGSTRVPGKVLRELAGDTVLGHVIRRVSTARGVDTVVVATTTLPEDDQVARLAGARGARVTRGSAEDVLGRYVQAFTEHGGDVGVRVTADCPCLDPTLLSDAIRKFRRAVPQLDYLSNTLERSFPRGYDFEVFQVSALRAAAEEAHEPYAREHVTPFIYGHPERFRLHAFRRGDPRGTAGWRLTLDTEEDWRVLRHVFTHLSPADPFFGLAAVERLISEEPHLLNWNRHVVQK